MRHRLLTALLCLLVLAALSGPCLAAEPTAPSEELVSLMEQFRQEHGLGEENFSICYYNTVTGEEYRWNDTRFMVAASTFKLPLNLYYYELERDGGISADTTILGVPLSDCRQRTLVWSDNDLAIAMLYRIGNFRTYKDAMLRYFTMPQEEISSAYYADNNYCTAMMLDALKYLYDRSEEFSEILGYMQQAQPESYFRQHVRHVDIAHKYGFFEGAVNDVGIVYTPQPFLLAVYTQNVGEAVVGKACQVLTTYTEEQALRQPPQEPELPPAPEPEPEPEPVPVAPPQEPAAQPEPPAPAAPQPPPQPEADAAQTASDNLWWMILVAASIFLVGDVAVLLVMKHGKPEAFWKGYEKRRK